MYFLNDVIASFEHGPSSLEESKTSHTNIIVAEEAQETQMPSLSDSASLEEPPIFWAPRSNHSAAPSSHFAKKTKTTAGSRDHDEAQ
jgi:hypothetical protein